MSALTSYAFCSDLSVRVQSFDGIAWFVAKDIALCLEYTSSVLSNVSALFKNVPDKWKQIKPFETKGGIQNLLAVTEQGLYRFLMRSDKPKAIPFQDWLSDEVLPAIRKQGAYMSNQLTYEQALKIVEARRSAETDTITSEQQYEVSSHVMRKTHALFGNRNYSAVYRALKRRFRIPRYTCLLQRDYETALKFIDSLTKGDFNLPDVPEKSKPSTHGFIKVPVNPVSRYRYAINSSSFTFNVSRLTTTKKDLTVVSDVSFLPDRKIEITAGELRAIKVLVYFFEDLFKPFIQWAEQEARRQHHPRASAFYDVWNEPDLFMCALKRIIKRNS